MLPVTYWHSWIVTVSVSRAGLSLCWKGALTQLNEWNLNPKKNIFFVFCTNWTSVQIKTGGNTKYWFCFSSFTLFPSLSMFCICMLFAMLCVQDRWECQYHRVPRDRHHWLEHLRVLHANGRANDWGFWLEAHLSVALRPWSGTQEAKVSHWPH